MKNLKITYWTATNLFCFWMIINACVYLTSEHAKQLCRNFGFPDYFRMDFKIATITGIISLSGPIPKMNLKE